MVMGLWACEQGWLCGCDHRGCESVCQGRLWVSCCDYCEGVVVVGRVKVVLGCWFGVRGVVQGYGCEGFWRGVYFFRVARCLRTCIDVCIISEW